ncbi:MAG: hypothetical protein A2Z25_07220 [Planctomycetes bacterium RBG_16_55_9]|nr:MAG: hypothetical protein A2Z25_07220 [Planctomycetes bacterium RBG_16_55_9]
MFHSSIRISRPTGTKNDTLSDRTFPVKHQSGLIERWGAVGHDPDVHRDALGALGVARPSGMADCDWFPPLVISTGGPPKAGWSGEIWLRMSNDYHVKPDVSTEFTLSVVERARHDRTRT